MINDNYLEFIKDKKICLVGSGASAERYDINFKSYDHVVGINRIYKTKYFPFINTIYSNGFFDNDMNHSPLDEQLLLYEESDNIFNFFILPINHVFYSGVYANSVKLLRNSFSFNIFCDIMYALNTCQKYIPNATNIKNRLYTGTIVLHHLLEHQPKSIDIYGFDFYSEGNISGIEQAPSYGHNQQKNKETFHKLLTDNKENTTHFI